MGPQVTATFIPGSSLVHCAVLKKSSELSRQSAEVTVGPTDPARSLLVFPQVLRSSTPTKRFWHQLSIKLEKGKKIKTKQIMPLELKWCSSSLSYIRSLNLNKIAWTPQRAWSCSKRLHSNVEPKTATFRAAHPKGRRAVHRITMQDLHIMPEEQRNVTASPNWNITNPAREKGNDLTSPARWERVTSGRWHSGWAATLWKANWWWYF